MLGTPHINAQTCSLPQSFIRRFCRCPSNSPRSPSSGANRARSIPEAAEALNLSVRSVWAGIAEGRIRSVKVSQRRRVVTDAEIDEILTEGAEEAAP